MREKRRRATAGQVLPFSVLLLVFILVPMFAFVGLGELLVIRTGAQAAADAAALAGAQQATVTEQVDALGNVYGYSVMINPGAATSAAKVMWTREADGGLLLDARTTAFTVRVDNSPPPGAPPTLSVVAQVTFPAGFLAAAGLGPSATVTVQSVAGTCGKTAWPGSASPWCSQTAG